MSQHVFNSSFVVKLEWLGLKNSACLMWLALGESHRRYPNEVRHTWEWKGIWSPSQLALEGFAAVTYNRVIVVFWEEYSVRLEIKVVSIAVVPVRQSSTKFSWRFQTLLTGDNYVLVRPGWIIGADLETVRLMLGWAELLDGKPRSRPHPTPPRQMFKRHQISLNSSHQFCSAFYSWTPSADVQKTPNFLQFHYISSVSFLLLNLLDRRSKDTKFPSISSYQLCPAFCFWRIFLP
jgi:hypothetical protein